MECRGAAAWSKIVKAGKGRNADRALILTGKIHNPKRVDKYSEVLPAFESWESYVKEFERDTNSRMTEVTKMNSLRQLVPKELELDMTRLTHLNTWAEMKKYVFDQVVIRREPYFDPQHSDFWQQRWCVDAGGAEFCHHFVDFSFCQAGDVAQGVTSVSPITDSEVVPGERGEIIADEEESWEEEDDDKTSEEARKVHKRRHCDRPPTEHERVDHARTHLPCRTWCPACVAGRGR